MYVLFAKILKFIPVELILLAAVLFWSGSMWDADSPLIQQSMDYTGSFAINWPLANENHVH